MSSRMSSDESELSVECRRVRLARKLSAPEGERSSRDLLLMLSVSLKPESKKKFYERTSETESRINKFPRKHLPAKKVYLKKSSRKTRQR